MKWFKRKEPTTRDERAVGPSSPSAGPSSPIALDPFDAARMREARDVDGLLRALGTPTTRDEAARGDTAARALAGLRDPRAREPLLAILELTPYPITREMAIKALGEIGDQRAVHPMIETFGQMAKIFRDMTILVRDDPRTLDPAVTPDLDAMLSAALSAGRIAITTAEALGKLGDPQAVAVLAAVAEDQALRESAESPRPRFLGNPDSPQGRIAYLPKMAAQLRDTSAQALRLTGAAEPGTTVSASVSETSADVVYAFFVRAAESAAAGAIDTSGAEKWKANIAKATGMPGAQVHLVQQGEWEAPKLRSVAEGCSEPCIDGIQRYFTQHDLSPMSRADVAREHVGDMKLEMTGLLVVLIKHSPSREPHP